VLLVGGAVGGAYGTGVNTEFSEEAFFPDEDRLETYSNLPEPFAPTDYTFLRVLTLFEEEFEQSFVGSVTLYVDQSVRDDDSLELIDRTTRNPPDTFETTDERRAASTSVVTVIEDQAARDPEFAAVVNRNDRLGTGVPDRNVDEVYDALLDSPAEGQARGYLAADRGSARIDYTIRPDVDNSEAVADVRELAERTPLEAVPTGSLVVNEAVIDLLTESAIRSLFAAFGLTAVFLALSYAYLEGKAVYGLLNLVPVLVTVGLLVGSMRLFDIPLTPINAPILSVSIGLGVDYTVHFVHRFVDEFKTGHAIDEALDITIAGTGGALTGSMLTTVCGLGVLWLAVIPLLRDFGVLLALGVLYAYLCSILLVPRSSSSGTGTGTESDSGSTGTSAGRRAGGRSSDLFCRGGRSVLAPPRLRLPGEHRRDVDRDGHEYDGAARGRVVVERQRDSREHGDLREHDGGEQRLAEPARKLSGGRDGDDEHRRDQNDAHDLHRADDDGAVSVVIRRLYHGTLTPATRAAVSSKVTYSSCLYVTVTTSATTAKRTTNRTAFSRETVERLPNRYWLMPTASPPVFRLMRTAPSANPVESTIAIDTSLYASVVSEISSIASAAITATTTIAVTYGEIPVPRSELTNSPTATPANAVCASASPISASWR